MDEELTLSEAKEFAESFGFPSSFQVCPYFMRKESRDRRPYFKDKEGRDPSWVLWPMVAFTEGGVRFPFPPLLIEAFERWQIMPHQCHANFFRVIIGIIKLNKLYGFKVGLKEVESCYYLHRSNYHACWYLQVRSRKQYLIWGCSNSHRDHEEHRMIYINGNEFPHINGPPVHVPRYIAAKYKQGERFVKDMLDWHGEKKIAPYRRFAPLLHNYKPVGKFTNLLYGLSTFEVNDYLNKLDWTAPEVTRFHTCLDSPVEVPEVAFPSGVSNVATTHSYSGEVNLRDQSQLIFGASSSGGGNKDVSQTSTIPDLLDLGAFSNLVLPDIPPSVNSWTGVRKSPELPSSLLDRISLSALKPGRSSKRPRLCQFKVIDVNKNSFANSEVEKALLEHIKNQEAELAEAKSQVADLEEALKQAAKTREDRDTLLQGQLIKVHQDATSHIKKLHARFDKEVNEAYGGGYGFGLKALKIPRRSPYWHADLVWPRPGGPKPVIANLTFSDVVIKTVPPVTSNIPDDLALPIPSPFGSASPLEDIGQAPLISGAGFGAFSKKRTGGFSRFGCNAAGIGGGSAFGEGPGATGKPAELFTQMRR